MLPNFTASLMKKTVENVFRTMIIESRNRSPLLWPIDFYRKGKSDQQEEALHLNKTYRNNWASI